MKDEKTKRKNGEGGRADAVVDGVLLRWSLQLRRRATKREQGGFGERGGGAEGAREREREMKRKEGDDVFIYNLGKITINYPKVYS